ncbi:4-hydroxy-tetrahydrodipicolinate synthase [Cohnella laeviribosi]|uniref:4-hydroxy-tetrahydrodipicolinate synthase n=1 Tax=Cohnella laeviribosi TaxID=380174 RepID=UPI003D1BC7F3
MDLSRLKGIFVPVVTPFDRNGQLDLASFEQYLQRVVNAGVNGLVINGTTGEAHSVKDDELQELMKSVRKIVGSREIPVVVGASSNDTATAVKKVETARRAGADGVLVVAPYYVLPSREGLIEHFRATASLGVPVIVYDNPKRTGVKMDADTICAIMELENVIGLKDSSGDIRLVTELVRRGSKPVMCGDDLLLYASLCCGATGGIVASASLLTERFVELFRLLDEGDFRQSRSLFLTLTPLIGALFKEPSPGPIKWLLAETGVISSDRVRLPLTGISDDLKRELEQLLQLER